MECNPFRNAIDQSVRRWARNIYGDAKFERTEGMYVRILLAQMLDLRAT